MFRRLRGGVISSVTYETNLRSVTWTKVSLKEAKIRATPKTISPITQVSKSGLRTAVMSTFANLRAQGDVLRGRTFDLLLGRHLEVSVDEIRTSC
jgi:hypothetical protein